MKNILTRAATIYRFEFSQEELRQAGGLESEQLSYMEAQARKHISTKLGKHTFSIIAMYWWFSYDNKPSTFEVVI